MAISKKETTTERIVIVMDKIIGFLFRTAEDLQHFDKKRKEEMQKYANKQCKKAFVVGVAAGTLLGFVLKATVF